MAQPPEKKPDPNQRSIDVSNEWDSAKLRQLMVNARRLGREDVYKQALHQLCLAEGRDLNDPVEARFAAVMKALEEALSIKNGKRTRLGRTRPKVSKVGARKTIEDLVLKKEPSDGFHWLLDLGMSDMTAEMLVLSFRSEFAPEVVAAAEARLKLYKVPIPAGLLP